MYILAKKLNKYFSFIREIGQEERNIIYVIIVFSSGYRMALLLGIFGILKQLLHLSLRVRQTEADREEEQLRQSPTQTLLNCFMLGWFIIGELWNII